MSSVTKYVTDVDYKLRTEPVRLTGWYALIVGLLIEVGLLWTLDTPVKAIVAAVLVTASAQVSGIEWARKHAYSPQAVNEVRRPLTTRIEQQEGG